MTERDQLTVGLWLATLLILAVICAAVAVVPLNWAIVIGITVGFGLAWLAGRALQKAQQAKLQEQYDEHLAQMRKIADQVRAVEEDPAKVAGAAAWGSTEGAGPAQ